MRTRLLLCVVALVAALCSVAPTAAQDWTKKSPAHVPGKRLYPAMAQFSNASQFGRSIDVVMFGGLNLGPSGIFTQFNVLGDTWVWNDTDWTQVSLSGSPPPRYGASMAYFPGFKDPGTGAVLVAPVTVLFGGRDAAGNYLNDTWLFSSRIRCGSKLNCTKTFSWTQVATTGTRPSGRLGASMALSATLYQTLFNGTFGQGIILTGGFDGTANLHDTWRFDAGNNTWLPDVTVVGEYFPGRSYTAVATCSGTNNGAWLFGGFTGSFTAPLVDTWHHHGPRVGENPHWDEIFPTSSPSPRFGHGMAFYPVASTDVLYGGQGFNSFTHQGTLPTDTWTSACADWTQAAPAHNPGAKSFQGMTTGPNGLSVVLFGGNSVAFPQLASGLTPNGRDSNETWTWGRRAACLPSPGSEILVGSEVICRFDASEDITFNGWSAQSFAPPVADELVFAFHTESPGTASITASWFDENGPQSQAFTYTIVRPKK